MTDGTVQSVDFSFNIKATASGGATVSKAVAISIVVCGFEAITLVSPSQIDKTLVVRDNVTDTIPVSGLFLSNDSYCPVNSFAVKISDAAPDTALNPTASEALNLWLDGLEVKLFAKDPATFTFWIQGVTSSGKYANQPA